MLLLQETHIVPRTPNISRGNPTTPREAREHSKNASTKKPKGSETDPQTCRLLQKVCTQILRYIKSTNTSDKEGCRVQMDPQM